MLDMLTIFHVLKFTGFVIGLSLGLGYGGHYFGIGGLIIGALGGMYLGLLVGGIPWRLALLSSKRELGRKSTEELRTMLHSPACLTPNFVLLELRCRGEDIQCELPLVLDMLTSDSFDQRGRGWAALTSAFPEQARKLQGYRISESVDECRKKTAILRAA